MKISEIVDRLIIRHQDQAYHRALDLAIDALDLGDGLFSQDMVNAAKALVDLGYHKKPRIGRGNGDDFLWVSEWPCRPGHYWVVGDPRSQNGRCLSGIRLVHAYEGTQGKLVYSCNGMPMYPSLKEEILWTEAKLPALPV